MILAIDFDGVIHDQGHPVKGKKMGPPMEGARQALAIFRHRGDKIIVFSAWGGKEGKQAIERWMHFYYVPFDEVTNVKPRADVYIDDKALHFKTWEETLRLLHDR